MNATRSLFFHANRRRARATKNQSGQGAKPSATQPALMAMGAFMAAILLSGCASSREQAGSAPWQYNLNTGYPAVGSDLPGHRHLCN